MTTCARPDRAGSMALASKATRSISPKHRDGDNIVYRWHYSAPDPAAAGSARHHCSRSRDAALLRLDLPDYRALGDDLCGRGRAENDGDARRSRRWPTLTKGRDGKREKAKKLYEWVSSHIRYVAVELGRGSMVPHAAQSGADQRLWRLQGPCRAAGRAPESQGHRQRRRADQCRQRLRADRGADLHRPQPHHHLCAVLDLYLDSTAVVAPFGVLPFNEYGKPVVFASPGDARRGTMPLLPPGLRRHHDDDRSRRLSRDGTLTGTTRRPEAGPMASPCARSAWPSQAAGAGDSPARSSSPRAAMAVTPPARSTRRPPTTLARTTR